VGVTIKIFGSVVFIGEVLRGSPADRAGIKAGDRVLAIDGRPTRGLDIPEMVRRMRGPSGTTVRLLVQRETREWTQAVVRGLVNIEAVTGELVAGSAAYVRITAFKRNAAAQLDALLAALVARGAQGVVLDLRHCPGGLLEVAVAIAAASSRRASPSSRSDDATVERKSRSPRPPRGRQAARGGC